MGNQACFSAIQPDSIWSRTCCSVSQGAFVLSSLLHWRPWLIFFWLAASSWPALETPSYLDTEVAKWHLTFLTPRLQCEVVVHNLFMFFQLVYCCCSFQTWAGCMSCLNWDPSPSPALQSAGIDVSDFNRFALRNRSCMPALRRTKSCRTWDWMLQMLFLVALWWLIIPTQFTVSISFPMLREPCFAWFLAPPDDLLIAPVRYWPN